MTAPCGTLKGNTDAIGLTLANQHVFMGILACKYLHTHVSPVAVEKKTFLISENYAGTRTHKI